MNQFHFSVFLRSCVLYQRHLFHFSILMIILTLTSSCKQDLDIKKNLSSNTKNLNSNEAAEFSYEIEEVVIYTGDTTGMTSIERLMSKPEVERQHVIYTIRRDGSARIESMDMAPVMNKKVPKSLPQTNNRPEIHKTVLDGAEMSLFDKSNRLLRVVPVTPLTLPNLLPLVEQLKLKVDSLGTNNNDLLVCSTSPIPANSLFDLLNNPPPNVIVQGVGNDNFTLRTPIDIPNEPPAYAVFILNTQSNRVIAFRLYSHTDELLCSMMYSYDNCNIVGYKKEVPTSLSTGRKMLATTYTTIENAHFYIN